MKEISREALCTEILKLNPLLWRTAQLAFRALEKDCFPIENHEQLAALTDEGCRYFKCDDGTCLSIDAAKTYMCPSFFPIVDLDGFIGRVHAALVWGDKCHAMEEELEHVKRRAKELEDALSQTGRA